MVQVMNDPIIQSLIQIRAASRTHSIMSTLLTLGVDIGGSHISLGWTQSGHSIFDAESISIDNTLVPEQVVSIIKLYVDRTKPKLNKEYNHSWSFHGVGICSPGMWLTFQYTFT